MTAADRYAETNRWLRYAEEDLRTAESLLELPHLIPRHACWLAQQATEKALKAVLISLQIDFPRSSERIASAIEILKVCRNAETP